jgi:hypothetical protein
MEKSRMRLHCLVTELSQLLNLDTDLDTVLAVSMYKLNHYMDSERSSIFVFDPLNKQLTSYSSLDLGKLEIRMPKSTGVAGWVFEHRMDNASISKKTGLKSKQISSVIVSLLTCKFS